MRHWRTVIWDWNGTLLNDARLGHRVLVRMCLARSMASPSFEDYQRFYEHPVELIYVRAGFDLERESIAVLCDEWHQHYSAELGQASLHVDSRHVLEALHRGSVRQCVLSALPHDLLLRGIEMNGIGHYFSHIQGLTDTLGRSKVENGHILMKQLGVSPAETVLIGDSTHDVETARALGIECLLVGRCFEHRDKLVRHGLPVIDDFGPILGAFSAL